MRDSVILYIGGFELPDKNAAAHRVLSNAKIFRELGRKVVFVGVDRELGSESNVLETYKTVQGFEAFAVPYPKGTKNWVKNMVNIEPYISLCKKLGNVSSIICYNFPAIALNRLRIHCNKNGMKCLADVTEWYSVAGRSIPVRIVKGFDTWYRMRIVQKKLDGLIVISRYLENYYRDCKNVVYIPTLTDTSEEKWKGTLQKSGDALKLVYAGNPGRKDRIDVLIEALQSVKRDYHLDVIGITKEQYLGMYPQHGKFLSGCQSIVFHGRLEHLATLEYIKKANYSCFFRDDDRVSKAGFPTKFAEALTCGTPVITNKTSNLDEYMQNGKNGVLLDKVNIMYTVETLNSVPLLFPVVRDTFDYRQCIKAMQMIV